MQTYLRQKLHAMLYRTVLPIIPMFAYNKSESTLKGYNAGIWAPSGYKWFAIDVDTLSSDDLGAIDEGRWK